MKSRYKLLTIFHDFCMEIQNQYDHSIKILHSDNALEHLSSDFVYSMCSHGIHSETSYANTPQQNGVAERKNQHLLEVTPALIFIMSVPQYFWADIELTACSFINQMPSSIVGGSIPYSAPCPCPLFSMKP